MEQYTRALCRNLEQYRADVPMDTIYFGGGTPSLLSTSQLARVLDTAFACFSFAEDIEITLEANPATVNLQQLRDLRKIGINRLSFGVQSLCPTELQFLHRLHTPEEAVRTVEQAAAAGFSNISCDIMLALPGQTPETLADTINRLTELPISHVSAYLLKVEPGTPFAKENVQRLCPDEDMAADLYLEAVEQLESKGFFQYEISNFSRPGKESRHNCKYWRCAPYLGIGASSHSCWEGKRFFVPSDLEKFLRQPAQETILEDAAPCSLSEQIMLGMRLTEGMPLELFREQEREIAQFCKAGFLTQKGERIAFTPKGFLVSNSILAELI